VVGLVLPASRRWRRASPGLAVGRARPPTVSSARAHPAAPAEPEERLREVVGGDVGRRSSGRSANGGVRAGTARGGWNILAEPAHGEAGSTGALPKALSPLDGPAWAEYEFSRPMTRTVLLLSLLLCARAVPSRPLDVWPCPLPGDLRGRARAGRPSGVQRLAHRGSGSRIGAGRALPRRNLLQRCSPRPCGGKEAEARRQKHDSAVRMLHSARRSTPIAVAAALRVEANGGRLRPACRGALLQGRDEEATRALAFALALSPGRALPLAATSPLFARTVERVHAALQEQPRGSVRFVSCPREFR